MLLEDVPIIYICLQWELFIRLIMDVFSEFGEILFPLENKAIDCTVALHPNDEVNVIFVN